MGRFFLLSEFIKCFLVSFAVAFVPADFFRFGQRNFESSQPMTFLDAAGNKVTAHYLDQKPVGPILTFSASGALMKVSVFQNGQLIGQEKSWFENGQPRHTYEFDSGVREGKSTEWYENGRTFRESVYVNGQEVSQKTWRVDGELYANYTIRNGRYYGLKGGALCEPSPSLAKAMERK
jgi:hypothetical protein